MLVANCPGAKLSGAKLSVFIMLVPNCPGAKLSGAKLSGAKLSYHLLRLGSEFSTDKEDFELSEMIQDTLPFLAVL